MRLNIENIQKGIKNTLIETLGIMFVESDDEASIEAYMPVDQHITQTMGILHGGATIALAESLAGLGSNLLCEKDEVCFGMQISASHISKAILGDVVHAKATIIHKGRTTHVWDINVFSQATGKLVSTVRITNAVVKK